MDAIKCADVVAVLLADRWHECDRGTFQAVRRKYADRAATRIYDAFEGEVEFVSPAEWQENGLRVVAHIEEIRAIRCGAPGAA